jgi:hypothetical protein
LGEFYLGESDRITIAKCNVQVVPIPDIYYLPTIKLFPANSKNVPVEYDSDDLEDFQGYTEFIEEEGYYHLPAGKD